jgi:hypothetical protein
MQFEPEDCCLPGDITVARVYSGWLIGRAMPPIGPGPWWEYIGLAAALEQAVQQARGLAKLAGVRAWFHEGGERYKPIPLDDSVFTV